MNTITVTLLLAASLPQSLCSWKEFDFSNVLPWASRVPVKDYKAFIDLRLVKKDWMPETSTLPSGDKIIDNYPGPVEEAFRLFKKGIDEYTYAYDKRPLSDGLELLTNPETTGYDAKLPSVFIIHTISEDANKFFVRNTVTALALRNFVKNFNVFTLDMPDLQVTMEQTVWASLFGDKTSLFGFGKAIATFIQDAMKLNLITLDKINIISFCFSSQLAGFVGRYLFHYHGKKIRSILGMDPYSILFSSADNQMLSKTDAEIVHIYHTNSMFFGSFKRTANADFVINDGCYQPGCLRKSPFATMDCSHQRAVMILWYSILYPAKFVGRQCSLYVYFKTCLCNKNPIATMSFPPSPTTKGNFYLRTTNHKPYAMGPPSAGCATCTDCDTDTSTRTILEEHTFTKH